MIPLPLESGCVSFHSSAAYRRCDFLLCRCQMPCYQCTQLLTVFRHRGSPELWGTVSSCPLGLHFQSHICMNNQSWLGNLWVQGHLWIWCSKHTERHFPFLETLITDFPGFTEDGWHFCPLKYYVNRELQGKKKGCGWSACLSKCEHNTILNHLLSILYSIFHHVNSSSSLCFDLQPLIASGPFFLPWR